MFSFESILTNILVHPSSIKVAYKPNLLFLQSLQSPEKFEPNNFSDPKIILDTKFSGPNIFDQNKTWVYCDQPW